MAKAIGQGMVGATRIRAKIKKTKKTKKSKVLVMRKGEEKVEVWRLNTKFVNGVTRSYAQGFTKGLLVMAARSRSQGNFALARIVGPDLTRDHHWVVKFVGDAENFDRTMGFRHLKVEKRYRVQKSADGDKNGYRNELKFPREWVAPVLITEGMSKGGLRSLFP